MDLTQYPVIATSRDGQAVMLGNISLAVDLIDDSTEKIILQVAHEQTLGQVFFAECLAPSMAKFEDSGLIIAQVVPPEDLHRTD